MKFSSWSILFWSSLISVCVPSRIPMKLQMMRILTPLYLDCKLVSTQLFQPLIIIPTMLVIAYQAPGRGDQRGPCTIVVTFLLFLTQIFFEIQSTYFQVSSSQIQIIVDLSCSLLCIHTTNGFWHMCNLLLVYVYIS